jgi:serine phosphatase RsbU (regulator of sigma subunit)
MPRPEAQDPTSHESRFRSAGRRILLALGLGCGLGIVLRVAGLFAALLDAVIVCTLFTVIYMVGFKLANSWVEWTPRRDRTPFQQAMNNLLRTVLLYTLLLLVAVGLVRLATGLNLLAHRLDALLTYFIGLTLTSVISGLHVAQSLVLEERARSQAELETFRLHLLEADHARKTQELEEARQLQLSMLPKALPVYGGLRFAHRFETATEVGGDTYDYRTLPDGSLLVAFGDATGHGLQAGLIVTAVKALFHSLPSTENLAEAMQIINLGLRGLQLPRMAMALTLLCVQGDDLHVCIAGMPPLFFGRGGDRTWASVRASGPPLGQLKHFPYQEITLTIAAGDQIVLCSDGFPECLNQDRQMLGYDRIGTLFLAHGHQDAEGLLGSLAEEAHRWSDGRSLDDDMSFLAITWPVS